MANICHYYVHAMESILDDHELRPLTLIFAFSDPSVFLSKRPSKSKCVSLLKFIEHKRGLENTLRYAFAKFYYLLAEANCPIILLQFIVK